MIGSRWRPRLLEPRLVVLRSIRSDESGAAAVLIALLGVLLMGFAALAVDYGHVESERAKAQVAADAVALAIAQDCAAGRTASCRADGPGLALATLNGADAASATLTASTRTVTVNAQTNVRHWFAPIIGITSSTVVADATARWTPSTTTGGNIVSVSAIPFVAEACQVPNNFANTAVTLRISSYSASCEGFLSPARQLARVSTNCNKVTVTPGTELRDEGVPILWGGCALPTAPFVVTLYDNYSYTLFGGDRYRVNTFAMFTPSSSSARVTSSGMSGTFSALPASHPDIVRATGTTVPGTVTLID